MYVIILRGIHGSGKSTLAECLGAGLITNRFDRLLNAVEHRCHERIVVDDTNILATDLAPYIQVADAFHYYPLILTLDIKVEVAFPRQTRVSLEALRRMDTRLRKERLPRSWAHQVCHVTPNTVPLVHDSLEP